MLRSLLFNLVLPPIDNSEHFHNSSSSSTEDGAAVWDLPPLPPLPIRLSSSSWGYSRLKWRLLYRVVPTRTDPHLRQGSRRASEFSDQAAEPRSKNFRVAASVRSRGDACRSGSWDCYEVLRPYRLPWAPMLLPFQTRRGSRRRGQRGDDEREAHGNRGSELDR